MLPNKIESERRTFPNENKRYSDNKPAKSLSSINNKNNFKKNMTQQNSAKRQGYYEKEIENKIKRKNLSR